MIKLIIFDLDGVMIDSCDIHYVVLNRAIEELAGKEFIITDYEHEKVYNGRSTLSKLELMVELKGIDPALVYPINDRKQELTSIVMSEKVSKSDEKIAMLTILKKSGFIISCASNCTRKTVDMVLSKLGVLSIFDFTLCNEDVEFTKPSPCIYLKAMKLANQTPETTLIVEDSFVGLSAAKSSGAFVCKVLNSQEVTLDKVFKAINYYTLYMTPLKKTIYQDQITVIIPMSGNGSRFANVGYKDPKPLIPVNGKPMISWVIDNIGIDAKYIYIVKEEHCSDYKLEETLQSKTPNCEIIKIKETTEGAACTVLLAREFINNNKPLLMINCDQYLEWNCEEFVFKFLENQKDALVKVSTFLVPDASKKWSYVAVDDQNYVIDVQEKNPISNFGTTGAYLWRHGCDFVRAAEKMIAKNKRVNNEFYVAPVINEIIEEGGKVVKEECDKFWSLGVPEDLEVFLSNSTL
jgi:HAD superfamily hydrolase (TIGR01509 family)